MLRAIGSKLSGFVKSISFFSSWSKASSYDYMNGGGGGAKKITDSVWAIGGIEATAQAVSSLDLKFVNEKNGQLIDSPNPIQKQWMNAIMNPGALLTQRQLLEITSMIFDIEGICYWILYDFEGKPIENIFDIPGQIIAYGPQKVKARYASEGSDVVIGWTLSTGFGEKPLSNWQVVRFWKTNPASYQKGLTIADKIESTLSLDKGARDVNKGFFENGARPSGVLTTTERVQDDAFREFAREFRSLYSAKGNSGKIPGLPHPYKFNPIGEVKDMDFKDLHMLTRDEIFGGTRIPKHYMGVNDSINYATAEVLDRIFWLLVVKPKIAVFEDVINSRLLTGTGMKVEFSFEKIPIIAKDEIEVRKKKLQLAVYYFNLGYPTNWINAKLGLGMDEIKEAWANEPHDPTEMKQVSVTGDNAGNSNSDSSKGLKSIHPKKRFVKSANAFDNFSDHIGNEVAESIAETIKGFSFKEKAEETEEDILLKARSGDSDAQAKYCDIVERATTSSIVPPMQKTIERYIRRLEKSQIDRVNAYLDGSEYQNKQDGERELSEQVIGSLLFNESKWDAIIIDDTKSYHLKAYKSGLERVKKELGGFSIFKESDEEASHAAQQITNKITRVNQTIRNDVQLAISKAIKDGKSNAGVIEAIQAEFDTTMGRANLIARQETGSAASKARWDAMSVEIDSKLWLDSGDSNVRPSHRRYSELGSKPMDYEYAPGLKHPQDQNAEAKEVINCRCVIVRGD